MVLRPPPQILMIDTDKVEDLIFLSYFTNYNLSQIHKIIDSVDNSNSEINIKKKITKGSLKRLIEQRKLRLKN